MSRNQILVLAVAALVATGPVLGEAFEVRLNNGNVIMTRYEPESAPWDDSMLQFMSVTGNTMAIPRADVTEVVSSINASGRGTYLDKDTILIGTLRPNDNLTPEELEALGPDAPPPPPNYNVQQFAEPTDTQGIPVWFTGQTTPPIGGGGGSFGGAAATRRGGGGPQFSEPVSNF